MTTEETKKFASLYTTNQNEEMITWVGESGVGFSIIRNYPENIPFIPARTKDRRPDSVCLIKIGFSLTPDNTKLTRVKLYAGIYKASRYLLKNHFDYYFEDADSPTKDSLEESKRSKQPIDLEDVIRYEYDREGQTIYDIEKGNQVISLNQIADDLFLKHIKTVRLAGLWFRLKVFFRDVSTNEFVEITKKFILCFLNIFLDKTIQNDLDKDMWEGVFKPYKHSHLVTLSNEKINLFNSGLLVPKKSALVSAFVVVAVALLFSYKAQAPWWIEIRKQSDIVQASFVLILVWTVDYLFPHLLLVCANLLIRYRNKVGGWKVKIK